MTGLAMVLFSLSWMITLAVQLHYSSGGWEVQNKLFERYLGEPLPPMSMATHRKANHITRLPSYTVLFPSFFSLSPVAADDQKVMREFSEQSWLFLGALLGLKIKT